ncbi:MAG: tRNA (uridine(34)/cytosine(34)/5-carboxymethylaminomethyluridine(34)-2'-O)-methyltransferase TrmL [Planctomycetes bacterium]|jgi:tRNA (cytidine/uridine-2'-O-)-methyltransferase|nr:tRNA (uridine(34)/cytosine(34)/5-carboxymethylaminomethyluridine(34)-2'-O)-methyltransferase TrmL [Planctomycetota bacterium]
MEICLIHPEIPHNSGCAARLAAATGLSLHLVEPLGFSLADRYLKRAGLDYWSQVDLFVHSDWESACDVLRASSSRALDDRLKLFSARGGRSLFETKFAPDDLLCFGSETQGLPQALLEGRDQQRVYVPIRQGVRSLNLANVVCLATYTALVSAGVPLPQNEGTYCPPADEGFKPKPFHVARRAETGSQS